MSPIIYRYSSNPKSDWSKDDFTSPPIVENDVWIGSDVIILHGIRIGNEAVIAVGTIVTKDVLDYDIVGGVPTKLIKYRFYKKHIKKIFEIQWWDRDFTWIDNIIKN